MDLNEALYILKKHNYLIFNNNQLNEFLKPNKVPKIIIDDVVKTISKITGESCTYEAYKLSGIFENLYLGKYLITCEGLFKNGELDKPLLNKILNEATKKYNLFFSFDTVYPGKSRVDIIVQSFSSDSIDHKYQFKIGNRLFIHKSNTNPDTIMRTGLRCKENSRNFTRPYSEPRIYLSSLESENNKSLKEICKIIRESDSYFYGPSGKFNYLIVLPKHTKLYKDERDTIILNNAACYTIENISPQNILYIHNSITDEEIIEFIKQKYQQLHIDHN